MARGSGDRGARGGVAAPREPHSRDGFKALRDPRVRAFILGRMASVLGTQFVSVAVGWELYERTGDPWMLGLVGLFSVAPVFVLMILAGARSDRAVAHAPAEGDRRQETGDRRQEGVCCAGNPHCQNRQNAITSG